MTISGYLAFKLIHIVSASVLFGTGLGTAWFMWTAIRTGELAAIRVTMRNVIMADWLFTTPAILVQPVTGVLLMRELGFRFDSYWFLAVALLYIFVGACWIPVVFIQYRIRRLVHTSAQLPQSFYDLFRRWRRLGYCAFTGVIALFFLMVFRPGL